MFRYLSISLHDSPQPIKSGITYSGNASDSRHIAFPASAVSIPSQLYHQNDVERRYAIHETRLASVKASLSLRTPIRLEFMEKRLSKNFHIRRNHNNVLRDNLKLLRALEDIHYRQSTSTGVGAGDSSGGWASSGGGGVGPGDESFTSPVNAKRTKGSSVSLSTKSQPRNKLNTLLARKRNARAALVARENQKMMEVR